MPLAPACRTHGNDCTKVGGIKFVLGRWVPQRLSCYKHFYCLVYQHTSPGTLAPLAPWQPTLLGVCRNRLSTSFAIIITHLWATNLARPQHIHPSSFGSADICCEDLIEAIVMNAIVMCSRTREIADNVGLKRSHCTLCEGFL